MPFFLSETVMRQKKPNSGGQENPLKYTQLSLWCIKQGFTTEDVRCMPLSRALLLMESQVPAAKAEGPHVREASGVDFNLIF